MAAGAGHLATAVLGGFGALWPSKIQRKGKGNVAFTWPKGNMLETLA